MSMSYFFFFLHKTPIPIQNSICIGHTYTTKLFLFCLKFKFSQASHILSGSYISCKIWSLKLLEA